MSEAAVRVAGRRPSRLARQFRETAESYAFLAPGLLVYAAFVLYPIVESVLISGTNWDGNSPTANFVGIANYIDLARDPLVWKSIAHTLIWLVINITVAPALGLAMAALVNQRHIVGAQFFRTVFFLPATITAVVIGFIWQWIYSPLYGILDAWLRDAGLSPLAVDWLGQPGTALAAVAVANCWQNAALFFLFYLAGLQQIPPEIHEAAYIEGASDLQTFRYVTFPLLRSTTTTVVALGIIFSLRQFDLVWTMTEGGPGSSTETLGTYIYRTAFLFNRMGYSAALSVVLLVLTLIVAIGFMTWRER